MRSRPRGFALADQCSFGFWAGDRCLQQGSQPREGQPRGRRLPDRGKMSLGICYEPSNSPSVFFISWIGDGFDAPVPILISAGREAPSAERGQARRANVDQ
jgi:hypothetical protein